nr:MAG TPA: hypothetical protein [Caudoviricetes sp.]
MSVKIKSVKLVALFFVIYYLAFIIIKPPFLNIQFLS